MNPRGLVAKTPMVAIGFAAVAILASLYVLWPAPTAVPTESFFTTDDGKTFYRDDATLVPPFSVGGKTAVRANVYRCPVCGKEFVGTMERYRPDRVEALRKAMAEAREKAAAFKPGAEELPPAVVGPAPDDFQVKRPGQPESAWHVLAAFPSASEMEAAMSGATLIRCSEHPAVVADPVMP